MEHNQDNLMPCQAEQQTYAYICGWLTATELKQAEIHIADCTKCLETVAIVQQSITSIADPIPEQPTERELLDQIYDKTAERVGALFIEQQAVKSSSSATQAVERIDNRKKRGGNSRQMLVLAATIMILFTGAIVWRLLVYKDSRSTENQANQQVAQSLEVLRQLTIGTRPNELRISGLNYAPYQSSRGIEETNERLNVVRAQLAAIDAEQASAETSHALARALMVAGQYQQALTELSQATRLAPQSTELLSDVAVAQLAIGNAEAALLSLDQALKLDPNNLAALFNRALVNRQLHRRSASRADWQRYLTLDNTSPWAGEVRKHLAVAG
jgi:tetratricopeptide (TPR) repeat protein